MIEKTQGEELINAYKSTAEFMKEMQKIKNIFIGLINEVLENKSTSNNDLIITNTAVSQLIIAQMTTIKALARDFRQGNKNKIAPELDKYHKSFKEIKKTKEIKQETKKTIPVTIKKKNTRTITRNLDIKI